MFDLLNQDTPLKGDRNGAVYYMKMIDSYSSKLTAAN